MAQHGLVSIIVPVYNVERYLEECLESLVRQDYPHVEIILVNDGSTDGSLAIAERFQQQYPGIRLISTPNQGQSQARNTGIGMATGEYILFVDSDDWIEPHTVSRCMAVINTHQVDVVYYTATAFLDGLTARDRWAEAYTRSADLIDNVINGRDFFARSMRNNCYYVNPGIYLYARSRAPDLRFLPGVIYEDNIFTTRLLIDDPATTVYCLNDSLYHYRCRPHSSMTEARRPFHVECGLRVAHALMALDARKAISEEVSVALDTLVRWLAVSALRDCYRAYDYRFPISVRRRVLYIVMHVRWRALSLKSLLACLVPEVLILQQWVRVRRVP